VIVVRVGASWQLWCKKWCLTCFFFALQFEQMSLLLASQGRKRTMQLVRQAPFTKYVSYICLSSNGNICLGVQEQAVGAGPGIRGRVGTGYGGPVRIINDRAISLLSLLTPAAKSDREMRFGLHSGPVTAGILKGDRARFQLFGTFFSILFLEDVLLPNQITDQHTHIKHRGYC
jgi:hypothetical protein